MFKRSVAKWILIYGAGLIVLLVIALFYVGHKVKSELESNLNEVLSGSVLNSAALNTAKFKVTRAFRCSGVMSFECMGDFELKNNKGGGIKLTRFVIRISKVRTNFISIDINSDLSYLTSSDETAPVSPVFLNLLPKILKIKIDREILDRKKGVIAEYVNLKLIADAFYLGLVSNYELESRDFINKNAIQSVQVSQKVYLDRALDFDNKIGIHQLILDLKSKTIQPTLSKLIQQSRKMNSEFSKDAYENLIDNWINVLQVLVSVYGENYSHDLETKKFFQGFSSLLKGEIQELRLKVKAHEWMFHRISFNELGLMLSQKLNQYYDMEVETK